MVLPSEWMEDSYDQLSDMIETERLLIRPLNYQQLIKYIATDHTLESELGIDESNRIISPELKEALEETILPNVSDKGKNYLYSTLWTIISKKENKMVGDLCFGGEPNDAGEVEIGYGTYEEYRGMGYMTEAVAAMIQWAESQPEIRAIIASTDTSNTDSSNILKRNNFIDNGASDTRLHWKLNIVRQIIRK
jgi:[ribosomal protein S5]-alanine N-acetyltransferase